MTELDPEIETVLELIDAIVTTPLHELTATQAREVFQFMRRPIETLPVMHHTQNTTITTTDATIPLRIYQPTAATGGAALVWFHGGGWVLGDLDGAEIPCREIAAQTGCTVISVDYRLAPEAPFPAAFEDCLATLRWTFENSASLGISPHKIAVGGDSAGGNLAACVAIAARDQNIPLIYQLLIYPVVEANFTNTSYQKNAEGYFLTRELMKWFWDHYVPLHSQREDTRVSPIRANLQGLPPAWVLTAGFDPLCDDGLNYAQALQHAGNRVSSLHVANTIHGFFTMPLSGGARARRAAATALSEALQPL